MGQQQFILGNEPLGCRPNVRSELARLRQEPLHELLAAIDSGTPTIESNDQSRYQEAYWFYYLSLDRYLHGVSVAARYSKGPRWTNKYTPSERKLAEQYRRVAPFLEYDLVNCLLHTRILLDRVAGLSRSFLEGQRLPSFTSFNDHKKFFVKLTQPYGGHEEYAEYIRTGTDWFDMPLREVRDKFVVHASPKHMRFLGYPNGGYELHLNIMLPDSDDPQKPFARVRMITVNPLRLSYDIEAFLKWFARYGLAALSKRKMNTNVL
jgi:hypothetical protein